MQITYSKKFLKELSKLPQKQAEVIATLCLKYYQVIITLSK